MQQGSRYATHPTRKKDCGAERVFRLGEPRINAHQPIESLVVRPIPGSPLDADRAGQRPHTARPVPVDRRPSAPLAQVTLAGVLEVQEGL